MPKESDNQRFPWRVHQWEELPKPRLSISEVSELFGVGETTLRYWEQETKLSPKRFPSGARWYDRTDLLIVEQLYYLVEVKGLTLKAASLLLDDPNTHKELEVRDRLLAVREKLVALRDKMDRIATESEQIDEHK